MKAAMTKKPGKTRCRNSSLFLHRFLVLNQGHSDAQSAFSANSKFFLFASSTSRHAAQMTEVKKDNARICLYLSHLYVETED